MRSRRFQARAASRSSDSRLPRPRLRELAAFGHTSASEASSFEIVRDRGASPRTPEADGHMDGSPDLKPWVDAIRGAVRDGKTPEKAALDLSIYVPPDVIQAALEEFEKQAARIRIFKIPAGFVDAKDKGWYQGPQPNDPFWPEMRRSLESRLPLDAVETIDQASSRIVAYLPNPAMASFDARGLVLGYVQSGKTANYSAVIAKAADAGYKLIIVLTGVHEALRKQTQRRLDREIVDLTPLTRQKWIPLTSEETDFRIGSISKPDAILSGSSDMRVIAVVKKNAPRLKKLISWSRRASDIVLASCPVLVIDDEADQASINTSTDLDPSSINDKIRELLKLFPRTCYVGYTATPFANVLIGLRNQDDDDLYPRDFIFDLPRPPTYFGSERLFGRDALPSEPVDDIPPGLDVVRDVPDTEIPMLQPRTAKTRDQFTPEVTDTLVAALRYFWLATGARWARGDRAEYSSMLVHTTMYVDVQRATAEAIDAVREATVLGLRRRDPDLIGALLDLWSAERDRARPAGTAPRSVTFDEILPLLGEVVAQSEVIIENAQSVKRLSYEEPGGTYIVVGGNVLSRGLTLEGLVVSYFVRAAGSYDTLLQMGRWFGYRDGYEDLPRIWMTKDLQAAFTDLALVEQEIRFDISRYESEGLTPKAFGPRIRCHPTLSITSPMKMRRAVDAEVSFSKQLVQTIMFHHRDREVLRANLAAAERLAERSALPGGKSEVRGAVVFRGVPAEGVIDFLEQYRFHENNRSLSSETLGGYIRAQIELDELTTWNVAFIGRADGRPREIGQDVTIGALKRAQLRASDSETARMGVIVSAGDLMIDLADRSAVIGQDVLDRILDRRGGVPLLLVYLLDKDGGEESGDRIPLDALDDVVGVALLFPQALTNTPQSYKTAYLAEAYIEEFVGEADQDDEPDAA